MMSVRQSILWSDAASSDVLDDEFVDQQESRLRDDRAEQARVVDALAEELNGLLQRRLSGELPEEGFGSGGTASFDLDQARTRHAAAAGALAELDAALARIAAGAYGSCEECGRTIGRARLEAIPSATRCLPCQAGRFVAR